MNKDRRRRLAKAGPLIADALARIAEARAIVAEIRDEEAEAIDNLSEGARGGDLGSDMQAAVDELESALDAIDGLDLSTVATSVGNVSNGQWVDPDAPQPRLTPGQLRDRQMARLPKWALDTMARDAARIASIEDAARSVFAERGDDPTEIVDTDYGSPTENRVIPTKRVAFPAFGITVTVGRGRSGAGVEITADRPLVIMPNVSNSIMVRTDDR